MNTSPYPPDHRAPSGCRWCGITPYAHFSQWSWEAGWHTYTPPPQALIKTRMLARRGRTS